MRPPKFSTTLRAAEWLLRIEEGPLTEADKAEFMAWLKASPIHVREYLGVARAGSRLPKAIKEVPFDSDQALNALGRFVLTDNTRVVEPKAHRKINGGSNSR